MQRFQLIVYPDDVGEWKNVDRWPDTEAKNNAYKIFEQLATLDPLTIGAEKEEGEEVPFLRFSREAQELFDRWRTDLELKIRSRDEHPIIEAHLSKYRSLMPSLALLFHLCAVVKGDEGSGPVTHHAAAMAAAWCDFLEAHARRLYQSVTQHTLFCGPHPRARIKAGKTPYPLYSSQCVSQWVGRAVYIGRRRPRGRFA